MNRVIFYFKRSCTAILGLSISYFPLMLLIGAAALKADLKFENLMFQSVAPIFVTGIFITAMGIQLKKGLVATFFLWVAFITTRIGVGYICGCDICPNQQNSIPANFNISMDDMYECNRDVGIASHPLIY